jgi:endo-1,4-beta-mannosidase
VGANLDPWRFMTSAGEVYSLDEIREWVRTAVCATGAKVIRVHMNGGAFEPSVGAYDEEAFQQLDRLIAACVENRVHVLISLRDYLWTPWPKSAHDPYWYLGGGTKDRPNKEAILTDRKAKEAFKAFVRVVLNRKNTLTGTVYKDDTNILGWELINEPPFFRPPGPNGFGGKGSFSVYTDRPELCALMKARAR